MLDSNNPSVHFYNYGVDALSYIDQGDGPITLLLIHGFGEDNQVWQAQINYLSKQYRVIAPNLPGVHCKPLPIHHSEQPTIQHYVQILHALMHHLDIEQYYIMGHSMGGYIGLAFADYYTNHVLGLGLIHSTSFADSDAKKASRLKVAEFLTEWGTQKYLETATPNLFGPAFKQAHPDQIQNLMDSARDISPQAMIQFVMAMRNRKAYTHLLTQQHIPIWMIIGDADIAVPVEDALQQAQLLPEKNVIVLNGVGHMGMLEATEQVNKGIEGFILNHLQGNK